MRNRTYATICVVVGQGKTRVFSEIEGPGVTNWLGRQAAYSFVTVAYIGDNGLMRLQARSLARYLDPVLAAEILVVENHQFGDAPRWRGALLYEYGSLAGKVRFVEARDLAEIPRNMSGWFSQQILKLLASSVVSTDRYVILDGKNHLVRPLTESFLSAPSGLIRSYLMNYENHPMRSFLENSLSYFSLNLDEYISSFTPTATPFVVSTQLVRDLVRYIESRESKSFAEAFVGSNYNRSEFFLLSAYILSTGKHLSDYYDFSGRVSPAIWPESTETECLAAIAASERYQLPFFAIHRRAFSKLSQECRWRLATFWFHHALFKSADIPLKFLTNPNAPADDTDISE
jgi:Family of unknown function (DUF6492)